MRKSEPTCYPRSDFPIQLSQLFAITMKAGTGRDTRLGLAERISHWAHEYSQLSTALMPLRRTDPIGRNLAKRRPLASFAIEAVSCTIHWLLTCSSTPSMRSLHPPLRPAN